MNMRVFIKIQIKKFKFFVIVYLVEKHGHSKLVMSKLTKPN